MRKLLTILILALPLCAQTKDTAPRILTSVTFANLGTPANGTVVYCSDCTNASPVAGSGSGVVARRENGAWNAGAGSGGTVTQTICSGTLALGTSAIASGAAATTVTASCTGLASTDNIMLDFNASPLAVTGYIPSAAGMLGIIKWPTANTVNVAVVNNTSSSVTPSAITLNYRVTR